MTKAALGALLMLTVLHACTQSVSVALRAVLGAS